MQTIKSIETKQFEIKLAQVPSGSYYVAYVRKDKKGKLLEADAYISAAMNDYTNAAFVFESLLQELEGN